MVHDLQICVSVFFLEMFHALVDFRAKLAPVLNMWYEVPVLCLNPGICLLDARGNAVSGVQVVQSAQHGGHISRFARSGPQTLDAITKLPPTRHQI